MFVMLCEHDIYVSFWTCFGCLYKLMMNVVTRYILPTYCSKNCWIIISIFYASKIDELCWDVTTMMLPKYTICFFGLQNCFLLQPWQWPLCVLLLSYSRFASSSSSVCFNHGQYCLFTEIMVHTFFSFQQLLVGASLSLWYFHGKKCFLT
jgi:hypothetical protein